MTDLRAVFKRFFQQYSQQYNVSYEQFQVANAIMRCRTAELGGHMNQCDKCGHSSIAYNSCRNRHCPLCQSIKRERWRIDRNADLLNCHYFHVVFTIPDILNPLCLKHPRACYDILMKAAADTLKIFASNKRYLGADIGLTAILHTWGQTLSYHPHVHFIVPGAGLCPITRKVKRTHPKFLFPVKALSRVFRALFIKKLKRAFSNLESLSEQLYQKDFVVFCKDTFDSPTHVVNYLCQYTHRVAIANHRILKITDQHVYFRYKDYRDQGKQKVMKLRGSEFIRRFMMHVLPKRFVKIRHYGMFAGRNRPTKLAFCQRLMNILPSQNSKAYSTLEFLSLFMHLDFSKCPKCDSNRYSFLPLGNSS